MNAKNLTIKQKTATITVEGDFQEAKIPALKTTAVYALLGGYNEVARHVDLATYEKLKHRFNDVVSDMAYELSK